MKTYQERYIAAIGKSSRRPNVEELISETVAMIAEAEQRHADQRKIAADPAVSADDARSAAIAAQDANLDLERLKSAHAQLSARLAELIAREEERATDAARLALIDDTTALAEKTASQLPVMFADLVALLRELKANAAIIGDYNRGRPLAARIVPAELQARGLKGHTWPGGGNVTALSDMVIPALDGERPQWPSDGREEMVAMAEEADRAYVARRDYERSPEGQAETARRERHAWQQYEVRQQPYSGFAMTIDTRGGPHGVHVQPVTVIMSSSQVDRARAQGLVVENVPWPEEAEAA